MYIGFISNNQRHSIIRIKNNKKIKINNNKRVFAIFKQRKSCLKLLPPSHQHSQTEHLNSKQYLLYIRRGLIYIVNYYMMDLNILEVRLVTYNVMKTTKPLWWIVKLISRDKDHKTTVINREANPVFLEA